MAVFMWTSVTMLWSFIQLSSLERMKNSILDMTEGRNRQAWKVLQRLNAEEREKDRGRGGWVRRERRHERQLVGEFLV